VDESRSASSNDIELIVTDDVVEVPMDGVIVAVAVGVGVELGVVVGVGVG